MFNFNILKVVSTIKNYASPRLMNLYLKILKHQLISIKKYLLKLEMVAHAFNTTTQRAEAGGSPGLYIASSMSIRVKVVILFQKKNLQSF